MSSINYIVDIDRLDETIEKIFTQIPEEGQRRIFNEVLRNVELALEAAAPYKTGDLRSSIRTNRVGKFEAYTGPTKKVGGHDLGLLLERGSKGGQTIIPTSRKWMKFFWKKTGQTHYAKKVTRGSIAPRRWVRKTVTRLVPEIKWLVREIWRLEYERNAT